MQPSINRSPGRTFSWSKAVRARHIALPSEHGAWIFLFSPLAIGIAAGGFRAASLLFILAALAGFLIRQPVTIAVKVVAGRRPAGELGSIFFWLGIYGVMGLAALISLFGNGYGFLTWLALPALPIFAWHLWLVRSRAERRQMLVEILGSGVLALAAPAAYWVGTGQVSSQGWLLWGMVWLQVTGTILYAYLRLRQRSLGRHPTRSETIAMGSPAFLYNLVVFIFMVGLVLGKLVPQWVIIAYLLQPLEVVWGMIYPAVGLKPAAIGLRQLIVSGLFTLIFILAWF